MLNPVLLARGLLTGGAMSLVFWLLLASLVRWMLA
jgi:hypothetical protein